MAEDPEAVLQQLRDELVAAGYGAVVQENVAASEAQDRGPQEALEDLIALLQSGVVTAMRAHAASIRNLTPRPGPRGPLWEPPPRRPGIPTEDTGVEFAIEISDDVASRIEGQSIELARLLDRLRDHADES